LAYYFFWKYQPFEKGIIIHDSLFIQPTFKTLFESKIKEITTVRFLWHFPHFFDEPAKEEAYLQSLSETGCPTRTINDVVYFQRNLLNDWLGCFGVMSVIDLEFLKKLVNKYHFFHWFTMVFSRNERYIIERVFAVLCCIEDRDAKKSLFGDIYETPRNYQFFWKDYYEGEWRKDEMIILPVLKVWSGR
jgi:hypothetical protein